MNLLGPGRDNMSPAKGSHTKNDTASFISRIRLMFGNGECDEEKKSFFRRSRKDLVTKSTRTLSLFLHSALAIRIFRCDLKPFICSLNEI